MARRKDNCVYAEHALTRERGPLTVYGCYRTAREAERVARRLRGTTYYRNVSVGLGRTRKKRKR